MIKQIGVILVPIGTLIARVLIALNPLAGLIVCLGMLAYSFLLALVVKDIGLLMTAVSLPLLVTLLQLGTIAQAALDRMIISYSLLLALGISYGQIIRQNHLLPLSKRTLVWITAAAATGLLTGSVQYLTLSSPWLGDPIATVSQLGSTIASLPLPLVILIVPLIAYTEEVVFRYLIYTQSRARFSPILSGVIANSLYASLWLPDAPRASLVMFSSGMLYSYIYIEQKNLLTAALANMLAKYLFLTAALFFSTAG